MSKNPNTDEWLPPNRKVLQDFFTKHQDDWFSCQELIHRTKLGVRTMYDNILTLYRDNEVMRKSCPCGKGWLYKYRK